MHDSGRDRAVKLAENDAIHLCPVDVVGMRNVGEDTFCKGIFPKCDAEAASPVGVIVDVEVEGDWDRRLHVEDADGLAVEGGDSVLCWSSRHGGDAETGDEHQNLGQKRSRSCQRRDQWRC